MYCRGCINSQEKDSKFCTRCTEVIKQENKIHIACTYGLVQATSENKWGGGLKNDERGIPNSSA